MSTEDCTTQIPYTYLIKWTSTGAWYYGVRYAKHCHPGDLWTTYFTSSKYVKNYVQQHGQPDIIAIRRVFSSANNARQWEHQVLRRLHVTQRDDSLNQTDNKSINPKLCSLHTKGKTYEQIYGPERAAKLKKIRSDNNRTNIRLPNGHSRATKEMMSAGRSKGNNSNAKSISIWLDQETLSFSCYRDCYAFLEKRFGITHCNAQYIIYTKLKNRPIPNRKNYKVQREVASLFSLTSPN